MMIYDNQCYPLFYFLQNKKCSNVMVDLIDKLIGGLGKERLAEKKFWTDDLRFN